MNRLLELLQNIGVKRATALGAIGLGAIGFLAYIMLRVSAPDMALLYSDLDPEDASHIVSQLEQKGIPFELRANGAQLYVPAGQVPATRMALAEQGLPRGGAVGYEIFDKPESLGTSNFVRDINRLRALEGELARTIRAIDGIKSARVHLVLPRRELFSRDQQGPSASIALAMRGAARLSPGQVAAIQHLVASAVPGLKTSRVSIIDDRGTLLARGAEDGDDPSLAAANAEQRRRAFEDQMRRKIVEILEPIVGADHVRAEVTADMDLDRLTTSTEEYDPNSQVARSTQTVTDANHSNESQAQPPVTVASNIPGSPGSQSQQGDKNTSTASHSEETTNYEISKTVRNSVRDLGELKHLSVAVMVDGSYPADTSGKRAYQPRSQAEIDQLTAMVRTAVGYDEKRGDRIELINMRFASADELAVPEEKPGFFAQFTPAELFRIAEMFVLGFVALLILLLVVRPLVKRLVEATRPVPVSEPAQAMIGDNSGGGAPALEGPKLEGAPAAGASDEDFEAMIDIGKVEGRVRHSSVKKIGQIIEKHPEEAVAILRNWMVQES